MSRRTAASCAVFALTAASTLVPTTAAAEILLEESFDDNDLSARGWFDVTNVDIAADCFSQGCLQYSYSTGDILPSGRGTLRITFAPSPVVYVRYYTRYSDNWAFRPAYGPHELYLLTSEDSEWIGPAETQLTVYLEHVEGRPTLAAQDALNVDTAQIGVDLAGQTEFRGAHGCNGASDAYAEGGCYQAGNVWRNGRNIARPETPVFTDQAGPYFQGDWHEVIVEIRLNDVVDGTVANGHAKYWFDGELLIDVEDVVWRTGANPDMVFQTLLIGPYFHDGTAQNQEWYIDELTVATTPEEVGLDDGQATTSATQGGSSSGDTPETSTGDSATSGDSNGGQATSGQLPTNGSNNPSSASDPDTLTSGSSGAGQDDDGADGCGCRSTPSPGPLAAGLLLLGLAAIRRRSSTAQTLR